MFIIIVNVEILGLWELEINTWKPLCEDWGFDTTCWDITLTCNFKSMGLNPTMLH